MWLLSSSYCTSASPRVVVIYLLLYLRIVIFCRQWIFQCSEPECWLCFSMDYYSLTLWIETSTLSGFLQVTSSNYTNWWQWISLRAIHEQMKVIRSPWPRAHWHMHTPTSHADTLGRLYQFYCFTGQQIWFDLNIRLPNIRSRVRIQVLVIAQFVSQCFANVAL